MKRILAAVSLFAVTLNAFAAADVQGRPLRETGKEAGLMLDLQKIGLGTISNVEQKKQYLSTVQLEKQRIQNYTLRMVYENAYTLYRRGDYQRAAELAHVILSIDPSLTRARTLATEAERMATYGTISEQEIINAKYAQAQSLYKSGRLLSAQGKYDEILVLRPAESRAQDWVRRIDNEIAQEHVRRGYYAYKNGDYNEALDQWYSVLLIKKDDKDLQSKISEVENTMRKEETQKVLSNAFTLYSSGKLEPAYKEFERAMEIQPGEASTQKYAMQLKEEISREYYLAGNKAYNSKRYNTAIANWTAAKNWGYNQGEVNQRVKDAERAQARAAAEAAAKKQAAQQDIAQPAEGPAAGPVAGDELPPVPTLPPGTLPEAGPAPSPIGGGPVPATPLEVGGAAVPIGGAQQQAIITPEARQASMARYSAGLGFYNQGDYEKAREEWQAAIQLNPENSDASIGLKRIEERYTNR
ncbi:MAG: tetratricopeptide repeat protein [Elusimicrobiota bacterium]|jgi:tetratricopeptide (TPR) repeat protein|nr:tetratricopeptide repeat protein [Elusimicrobiota bacterium]